MKSKDVTHRVYSKTIVSAIILAFFISAVNLHAVDSTWQPDSGGSWGTAANWNNGVPDGTDDIARFVRDFTDAPTFTLDGSRTVNKLYYKDTGGTLRIGTISIGTAGTLTLGGSTKPEINVQGNNLILDVPIAGSNGFVKEGDKRLELLGDNTYSGVTELRSGQISIKHKNAFGASTLEMYTGEIWQNVNVNAEGESVTNNIVLAGSAGSRGINKLSSKIRYSGVISGPSDIQLRSNGFAAGEIIFAGNNTFAGGFKNTAGSIRLGHNNGFGTGDVLWQDHNSLIYLRVEGDLARDGGAVTNNIILDMDNTDPQYNTFNVDTGGSYGGTNNSLTLSGVISGPNKLVKYGNNTLNLSGANTYSGGTLLHWGILIIQHVNALGSGTLEMDNGSLWFDTPILDTGDGIQNDIVLNSGSFNFNTLGGNHRVKL